MASEIILKFPKDIPKPSSGVLMVNKNLLITGHENGLVVKWDLNLKSSEILYRFDSEVGTISLSKDNKLAIGSHAGDLIVITFEPSKVIEVIQEATYNKQDRVWRTTWVEDSILTTSTYGVMNVLRKVEGKWRKESLPGHSNSVFALNKLDEKIVASGDYRGNIIIWKQDKGVFNKITELDANGTLQDVTFSKYNNLATINKNGIIFLFEMDFEEPNKSIMFFEIDSARGRGNCIHITEDGSMVFSGTDNEIIQFDLNSQQMELIDIKGNERIFSDDKKIYTLNHEGLLTFDRKEIVTPAEFIKYKHVKVSLIGHTGVGKSTLCNFIMTGSPGELKGTFGKRVWNWVLKGEELEKRVIFHDYGGQETVIGTFIPLLKESDIILVLFSKKDRGTLTKAIDAIRQLRSDLRPTTKIFLIETHIDEGVDDINRSLVDKLIGEKEVDAYFKVCPLDGTGIDEFKEKLLGEIAWKDARIMIQSKFTDNLINLVNALQDSRKNISFKDLQELYKKKFEFISQHHLKFLLGGLNEQGIVDFIPEISDLVIINDEDYNKLRTNIPIYAEKFQGMINFYELLKQFNPKRLDVMDQYIKILDAVYLNNDVAIRNFELRIFPEKLSEGNIDIPPDISRTLTHQYSKRFRFQKCDNKRLIKALSELNLRIIKASQTEGIFSWNVATVYYIFQQIGNAVSGRFIECTYYIGGTKEEICDRLKREFESILEKIYGSFISETEALKSDSIIKKKLTESTFEYTVALSFAGEQRKYAEELYLHFVSRGIKCFCDEMYKEKLWGANLPTFLKDIYYSKSRYCVMLISKEYVTKAYPLFESENAIARQIEQGGKYILPVKFDNVDVPGLPSTIGYLNGNKTTPAQVGEIFLKKIEGEN